MAADQLSEAPQITRLIDACAAAADELAKTRSLVDALERENVEIGLGPREAIR